MWQQRGEDTRSRVVFFLFYEQKKKKSKKKDERAWWRIGRAAAASAVRSEEQNILEDRWRQDEQTGERWANHRHILVSCQQVATHGDGRFPWVTVFHEVNTCDDHICKNARMLVAWQTKRIRVGEQKKNRSRRRNPWATKKGGGGAQRRRTDHLRQPRPSVKPDTQQNYVLLFCSSWIKAVKQGRRKKKPHLEPRNTADWSRFTVFSNRTHLQ